jgi:hypothetical protein
MAKNFSGRAKGMDDPADRLISLTPNDGADLPNGPTRGVFIGIAGSLTVRDMHGNEAVLTSLDAQYHPIRITRLLATGTTASSIIGLC